MTAHTAVAGERPTAAQWNAWVFQRVLADCTSSTRPGSPVEGMPIFETDTDKALIHDGSGWVELGKLGAWTAYTPTWTTSGSAPSLGNGVVTGRYHRMFGRTYFVEISFVAGSTTTFGSGSFQFTLPSSITAASNIPGSLYVADVSGTPWIGTSLAAASTVVTCFTNIATGDARAAAVSATSPFTWTTSDYLLVGLLVESTS